MNISSVPKWLISLLTEKFYNACILHEAEPKNEKNIFCVDCCEAICPHCCFLHSSHRLLTIRRYVYHDVIRVSDGEKFFECKHVQSFTTNGSKVVFLNQRPQTGPQKTSNVLCLTCRRRVHYPFRYCSISCKIEHLLRTGCKLSNYIRKCERLTIPQRTIYDGLMTPDSVLEPSRSFMSESGSSTCLLSDLLCPTLACTATTEIVKKKRSNLSGARSTFRPNVKPVFDVPDQMPMDNNANSSPIKATSVYKVEPAMEETMVVTNGDMDTIRDCEVEPEPAWEDTESVSNCENSILHLVRPVCGYRAEPGFERMNKRKGAPRRAPLY